MKIYYLPNGEIWNSLLDRDVFTTHIEPTAQTIEVDEIPENSQLIQDMTKHSAKRDVNSLGRWYVENGELFERDGWQEDIPLPPLGI